MKNRRHNNEAREHRDTRNRDPEDAYVLKSHRESLWKIFIFLGCPFLLLFGAYHMFSGNWAEGIIDAVGGIGGFVGYMALKQIRSRAIVGRALLMLVAFVFLYFLFKAREIPDQAAWCYVYPLITLFMLGKREGLIWAAVFYLLVLGILVFPGLVSGEGFSFSALRIRFLISLALVSIMAYMFEAVRHKTEQNMLQKKHFLERSEENYRNAFHELEAMQHQLIQSGKLASIGKLVSGVAHELNQPLTVIRGTVQLILRNFRKNRLLDHIELEGQLESVEKNTKRMMNIINHLRTFSRQPKGDFSRLDINLVVREAFTLISEQLRLRNIKVVVEYASGLPPIRGDKNQIEQVLLNIIANARDAMNKGAGDSEGDQQKQKILRVSTSKTRDSRHLEIRISDSGQGIPPGGLDRIFDPFFTTKEVGKGTGLGLSISYGIIKDHGGQIEVAETGPEGTTFRIILPVADRKSNIEELSL